MTRTVGSVAASPVSARASATVMCISPTTAGSGLVQAESRYGPTGSLVSCGVPPPWAWDRVGVSNRRPRNKTIRIKD